MDDHEALPELPSEVADAWANVLIDVYEKQKSHADSAGSANSQDGTSTDPGRMNDLDSCTDA